VALPAEVLDLLDVVSQNGRLSTLMISVELGEVVDLDIVHDRLGQPVGSIRFSSYTLE
jgi:hypothetical protein